MDRSDKWQFDINKLYVVGNSMGGTGASMLTIRYPEKFTWCKSEVGVHDPNNTLFKTSFEKVYGNRKFNPKFQDGTSVWDYYNDIWYLNNNREKGVGLIIYSNGKNDKDIGWEQAVDFTNTLQETKQAHIFIWGQDGHGQKVKLPINQSNNNMLLDLKANQSLPAFTNCSLDDDYGDGNPTNGDKTGQVNGYLVWDPETIIDNSDSWQICINLVDYAPKDTCTVDITARKLQNFKLKPGEKLLYYVKRKSDGKTLQSGNVFVNEYGIFTIDNITISKEKYSLIVRR